MTKTGNALRLQPIADPAERDIIARYAQGHDLQRIAADTGRGLDGIANLVASVAGYDRGRAAAAIRAWDAQQPAGTRPAKPSRREIALQAENTKLRAEVKQLSDRHAIAMADLKTQLAALQKQLREAQQQLTTPAKASPCPSCQRVDELIGWSRPGSGAAILIDHIRTAREGDAQ